jgi:serine/threonine protein kinase
MGIRRALWVNPRLIPGARRLCQDGLRRTMAKDRKARLKDGEIVGGRYRIDGVVGKGGFGAVYRATQLDTGIPVALKVLLANYSTSDTDSRRFKREASVVKGLSHPNIVQLLDFGQTDKGVPFIAFELLQGQALAKVLKSDGAFSFERTVATGIDVLRALQTAHDLGIIHRDIKPQNVFLLEEPPFTKVLDFGIAKAVKGEESTNTQLTESGQMIGTPHYMAPEQVRGTGVYPATDLYALGLVMAEMLTGQRVVVQESLIEVYMTHISDKPIPLDPRVVESPLGPIIQRATAKVREARYASAGEMLAALEPLLGASAPTARNDLGTQLMAMVPEHYGLPAPEARPRMRSNNAFAAADQMQNLSGTVMMDMDAPRQPVALDRTFDMAQSTRTPRMNGIVDEATVEQMAPVQEMAAGTLLMEAFEMQEPPSSGHRAGPGAQAMTQLALSQAAPPLPQRSAAQSWMSMGASTPMAVAAPPAPVSGNVGPWSQPQATSNPMQAHALAMAQLPPSRPAQKSNTWMWILAAVFVAAGAGIGLWLWAQ